MPHSILKESSQTNTNKSLRIFLCGDVMTGRGIDQIQLHQSKSKLYEPCITDAQGYVQLAEKMNGRISYPVTPNYIWGEALAIWEQQNPDIKIINLETSITRSDDYWPGKGINYRMHPLNIDVLTSAGIDICSLANNHVLDWGYSGLEETLATLKNAGIRFSGAGKTIQEAMSPAIVNLAPHKRILFFSVCMASSGVPSEWEATDKKPGVYYCCDINKEVVASIVKNIKDYAQPNDLIIFSIHWGSNWGYSISESFRYFAHALIDEAHVDVIFGHSSHHPRSIEMYRGKTILYGCGDFINDYEGISGYELYRGDLAVMYFLDFNRDSLQLEKIKLIPMQIKKLSLHRANKKDCEWILQKLNQSSTFNIQLALDDHELIYYP